MADFKQATQWLNENKNVRRTHWCKTFYIKKCRDGFIYNRFEKQYNFKINNFFGDDWEIYKEPIKKEKIAGDDIKTILAILCSKKNDLLLKHTFHYYSDDSNDWNNPIDGIEFAEKLLFTLLDNVLIVERRKKI